MKQILTDPFPDPRKSTDEGLVAVGGEWSAELLLLAYRKGIFPWPQQGLPILWFSPDPRGILDFADLHIPSSLLKFQRKNTHWKFSTNKAFAQVMQECRVQARPNQDGSWILPEMEPVYLELQKIGRALSIECWDDGQLIGGIYGVRTERYFSAESMFYAKSNASKLCFIKLVEHLKAEGLTWMDIQMLTEVSSAFGGKMISRDEFLKRIS